MQVTKTSRWLRGLALFAAPIALVLLAGAGLGAQSSSLAGTITLAADENDPSTFVFLGGIGEGAFLGVSVEEEIELDEGGARVTHVVEGSPAEEAGIEEGDIIVGFDGETIRGPVALTKKIRAREPGDAVSLVVVRGGSRRTLEAEMGDRSESWTFDFGDQFKALQHLDHLYIPEIEMPDINLEFQEQLLEERLGALEDLRLSHCEGEDEDCILGNTFFLNMSSKPRLGVQLVEVTPELRQHMGADEDAGVMVSKVIAGTPAESAGIRVGDLIVALDGEKISGTSKLRKELQQRVGQTFDVEVIRDRTPLRIQVTLPEPENEPATGPRAWVRPVPRAAPRALPAVPAVPGVSAVPAPAAAPHAVPAPAVPPAHRDVVREEYEMRRQAVARAEFEEQLLRERALARSEAREVREVLERERALARAEAHEVREVLERERALARAEAREGLERERALARAEAREGLERERALARAEAREVREVLERERALARSEAREAREAVRRSHDEAREEYRRLRELQRQEAMKRRAAPLVLL